MSNTTPFPDRVSPQSYHKNPRQITGKQLNDLKESLGQFGDISGFVHDVASNQWVGGHMRDKAIQVSDCEIEIVHRFDEPQKDGTVALGYVIYEEMRFNYRAVEWTAEQIEQANIQANKLGGQWDFDILADQFEVDDLLSWGFTEFDLGLGGGGSSEDNDISNVEFQEFDETVAKTVST